MKPFQPIKPGDLLQEEIDARGWSQADLASILHRPVQAVNEIITGKKAITAETARSLSAALGTTARYWLNLEASYRLDLLAGQSDDSTVARRARLYNCAPVADMLKRRWIQVEDPKNQDQLEKAVCRFYEASSLSALEAMQPMLCLARKSDDGPWTSAQWAWITMVKRQAKKISCPPFKMERLAELAERIRGYSQSPEMIQSIPESLRQVGVKLVLVETFPRTKIDGIAFCLDGHPVIGLSIRLKRIDYFFFTLVHEIVHILHGDVNERPCLDVNILEEQVDQTEALANDRACDLLVPPEAYRAFLRRHKSRLSRISIQNFASQLGIHPAIIIGRLHFDKHLPYSHLRALLGDVRALYEDVIIR